MQYFNNPIPNLSYIVDYLHPGIDFRLQDDSDGFGPYPTQNQGSLSDEFTLNANEPAAMAAKAKVDLTEYADTKALIYGADMIDPNSATFDPIADSTADVNTIRQQQGKARARMQWGKRNGSAGGGPTVPGSQARNNAAQTVEENLAEEVVKIGIDIDLGAVTTEAQVDARITAIDLTY